jgi:hypothetical protein
LRQIKTKVRIKSKKDYSCMYHYLSLHEFYICVFSKSRTTDPNWSFIKNDNCLYISFPQSSCEYCCLFLNCTICNSSTHSQTQYGV